MKRLFSCTFFLFSALAAFSQPGRQTIDAFPRFGDYERSGWEYFIGVTDTPPMWSDKQHIGQTTPDSSFMLDYAPKGQLGLTAGLGRFTALDGSFPFFNFISFDASGKYFRGKEINTASFLKSDNPNDLGPSRISTSSFADLYLSAALRAGNITNFSDYSFISNCLGLNFDYRMMEGQKSDPYFPGANGQVPGKMLLQLHYQLGYGMKISKRTIMHISVETPILNMYPFDQGRSTFYYFHTHYRPVIARIAFLILDKKPTRKCPSNKAPKGEGKSQLWDSKMSKSMPH